MSIEKWGKLLSSSSAALPPPAPAPRRQADRRKTMQAAGGPNIEPVMRDIDPDMGPNPDPIPSERCGGGESRPASIERMASRITRRGIRVPHIEDEFHRRSR